MTIALNNSSPIQYPGNGSTVTFSYPWKISAQTDLVVGFVVGGIYTQQTFGYTVSGIGLNQGGSITFNTAPGLGTTVDLRPLTPETQGTEFANLAAYLPESSTNTMDRIVRMIQDLTRLTYTFGIHAPDQESIAWPALPGASIRANTGLVFDENGLPNVGILTASPLTQALFNAFLASTPTPTNTIALGSPVNAYLNVYLGPSGTPALDPATGTIGFYARTAAEIAASIIPTNCSYLPGHAFRYHITGIPGISASNDTAALLGMFTVCIKAATLGGTSSCTGYIPAGTWLVNEGVLVFDTGYTDQPWPEIRTAGNLAVTFKGANFADAPMLTWKNGTATSGAFFGWRGGSLGGITFITSRSSGSNSHAMSITGLWGIQFGWMKATNLFGALLYQPLNVFGGSDPDPYSVNFCTFYGLEAIGCTYLYQNLNGLGSSGNYFLNLDHNGSTQGVVLDGGSTGNVYGQFSCGAGLGWAFDTGANALNRCTIIEAEIDGQQFGIRVNAGFQNEFRQIRFAHEFQLAPNTAANYWPRICMDITGLSAPNLQSTRIQATHRISSGGTHGALGVFCDFHNSNATNSDVVIENNLSNQSAIVFADKDFFRNLPFSQNGVVLRDGRRINDVRIPSLTKLAGNATTSILNSGFGTTANVVAFPTVRYDPNSLSIGSTWIAPWSGPARFKACLCLTVAAGTRVRMALMELINNAIATTGSLVGGSGYSNGTYTGVALTGGSGVNAIATIVVSGNAVTSVTLTTNGNNYQVGDVLSAYYGDIGGSSTVGTGFTVNVATITATSFSAIGINMVDYTATANVQSFRLDGHFTVARGYAYCITADQNTGGAVAPSIPSGGYEPDLYFEAEMASQP